MYTPGKYDTMHVDIILSRTRELVKDPEFLKVFLQTLAENFDYACSRMELAESMLRQYGHKGAHRPITFKLLEQMTQDAKVLLAIANAIELEK